MRPERLARAPSRRRPAPPSSLAAGTHEGCPLLDLGDAVFEPSTSSHSLRSRLATHPSRGEPDPPFPGRPRQHPQGVTPEWTLPLARPGRWWAPLLPGGPTPLGFRPSSNRLAGSSSRRRSAHPSFWTKGPRGQFTSGETLRHRNACDPSWRRFAHSPGSAGFRRRSVPRGPVRFG